MRCGKFAVFFVVLGCVALGQPRPFVDTFGPNNSTRSDAIGFGRLPGGATATASAYFIPDRDIVLTRIEMGIQLREGTNELRVTVHEEDTILERPGNILELFRLTDAMERRSAGYGVVRIESILRPRLQAGQRYWISAAGVASDTFAGWGFNNVGDVVPRPIPKGMAASNPRPTMRLWGEFTGGPLLLQTVHSGRLGVGLAKDTWITLFGVGLSNTTRAWSAQDFANGRLPTQLDGVRVLIDGEPAVLSFVSPGQINALVLNDSAEASSTVQVTGPTGNTAVLQVRRFQEGPGAFGIPGTNEVAAIHADGTLVGQPAPLRPARVAKRGDVIAIFATGLGATAPGADVNVVPQSPTPLASPVQVELNGQPVEVLYVGRVGPGLFQINIRITQNVPSGPQLPVWIKTSGAVALTPLVPSSDPTIAIE